MARKQTLRQILDRLGVKSRVGYMKKPRRWTTEEPEPVRIEPDDAYVTVRYDLLRFLLQKGHIDRWQFFVGRRFQQIYLSSLIQPPRCSLNNGGFGRGTDHRGYARADIPFPSYLAQNNIKLMSDISARLSPADMRAARAILCAYSLEDETGMKWARPLIHKHPHLMAKLLNAIGWAIGMTTQNPYEAALEPTPTTLAIKTKLHGVRRDKRKRFNLHLEPRYREAS